MFLTALENSWIHLRRKKRDRVRQLRELPRASVDFLQTPEETARKNTSNDTEREGDKSEIAGEASVVADHNHESPQDDKLYGRLVVNKEDVLKHLEEKNSAAEAKLDESESVEGKEESSISGTETQTESGKNASTTSEWFLFKCVLIVKKEGPDFLVEMHWIEGQNRDLMNQLCTYLKNQMFRLVTI